MGPCDIGQFVLNKKILSKSAQNILLSSFVIPAKKGTPVKCFHGIWWSGRQKRLLTYLSTSYILFILICLGRETFLPEG